MTSLRRAALCAALLGIAAVLVAPAAALAAEARPAWALSAQALPSNFAPGVKGNTISGPAYLFVATNVGAEPTDSPATVTVTLAPGLEVVGSFLPCAVAGTPVTGQTLECEEPASLAPGESVQFTVGVQVPASPPSTSFQTSVEVTGGAAPPAQTEVSTPASAATLPFDFLPGFAAPPTGEDGLPTTQAGSHPYQLTIDAGFPAERLEGSEKKLLGSAGHLRDLSLNFPPGELIDPAATPLRCAEAELTFAACPASSQVGTVSIGSVGGGGIETYTSPLFNMVTPPGIPAMLGFDAFEVGIYIHTVGEVRSDGDYGLTGATRDALALTVHPVFGIRAQLWGDPTAAVHDAIRGGAATEGKAPMLTTPSRCGGPTPLTTAHADSWEAPTDLVGASFEGAAPDGCERLSYEPTISSRPTTTAPDAPSGLDFDLHQPQSEDKAALATPPLREATVTLPEGLVANPSQASGLDVCTEEQIGYLGEGHYSKDPNTCPEASKLGTLEVTSPLLAEYTEEGTRLATDPQTGDPIPRPLHGSVYLAKPFDNQFGSLLALYLAVEDERSGIVAKLAGEVVPDPNTGQLTTVFTENPQLPLEDVRLHLFEGARAPLTTPLTCGPHATTSTLTPWSAPATVPAHPTDSFQIASSCAASEGAAPNAPIISAGTESAQAGAYSPFVLKLSREDGSQRLTGIDTTLPEGLTGRLAGIAQCSDAQIAQAESRNKPEEGRLERESPSCPSSSEVGTVTVAAGSGPTPFHTTGHAYLAGPYKGAPLSLAVIVPAIAGPFDLGTVVTRVALYVEPETTRIHAVSDPLPTILDGIPLDLRSIELTMGRPGFTLNPTSCEPKAITGTATSSLGAAAALTERFQVGGCSALPFKPRLSLRLKGKVGRTAHPRLIANLRARGGEANIARAQVKLPPAAFIDQGHIRTICTRVQWAANTCPAGSVYGSVWATTPLLSYKLTGRVYLRSSSHKLPDLVAKLMGPASQPIEIDLDGKTDSVKGALRNTFEAVPDAPVSTFHLELFGGKRGLVEMSSGFCGNRHASVDLTGQNGKVSETRPLVAARCPKARKHKKRRKGHGRHHRGHGSK